MALFKESRTRGGVAAVLVSLVFLLALTPPVAAFEADWSTGQTLGNGTYLLQLDSEAPQVCHSHSRVVSKILESNPDATIERHRLSNGAAWLFARYSALTGVLFAFRPFGLICESYALRGPVMLLYMALVEGEGEKIEVLKVWPEPED